MSPPEFINNRISTTEDPALGAFGAENHNMRNNGETARDLFLADSRNPGQSDPKATSPSELAAEEYLRLEGTDQPEATDSDGSTPKPAAQVLGRVGMTMLPGLTPVFRVVRALPGLLNVPTPPKPQVPGEQSAAKPADAATPAQPAGAQGGPELTPTGLTVYSTKDGKLVVPLSELSKLTNGANPLTNVSAPVQPDYATAATYQPQIPGQQFVPAPVQWTGQPQPMSGGFQIAGQPSNPGVPWPPAPGQGMNPGMPQRNFVPQPFVRPGYRPAYPPNVNYPLGLNGMAQTGLQLAMAQGIMQQGMHNRGGIHNNLFSPTNMLNPVNPLSLTNPISPIGVFNPNSPLNITGNLIPAWNPSGQGYMVDANGNPINPNIYPNNPNTYPNSGGYPYYPDNGGYPYYPGGGGGDMQQLMALGYTAEELAYLFGNNGQTNGAGAGAGAGGGGSNRPGTGGAIRPMPERVTPTPGPTPEPHPTPTPHPNPPHPKPPEPPKPPKPKPHVRIPGLEPDHPGPGWIVK